MQDLDRVARLFLHHQGAMQSNHRWYPQHAQPYRHPDQLPDQHHPPAHQHDVHDAQRLLAAYPIASATPTAHGPSPPHVPHPYSRPPPVARHLGPMTAAAPPPSFVQPGYYSPYRNPPPYTEHAQGLAYLAAPQPPAGTSPYWEHTTNDAVRLLEEQAGPYVAVAHTSLTRFAHAFSPGRTRTPPPPTGPRRPRATILTRLHSPSSSACAPTRRPRSRA